LGLWRWRTQVLAARCPYKGLDLRKGLAMAPGAGGTAAKRTNRAHRKKSTEMGRKSSSKRGEGKKELNGVRSLTILGEKTLCNKKDEKEKGKNL